MSTRIASSTMGRDRTTINCRANGDVTICEPALFMKVRREHLQQAEITGARRVSNPRRG